MVLSNISPFSSTFFLLYMYFFSIGCGTISLRSYFMKTILIWASWQILLVYCNNNNYNNNDNINVWSVEQGILIRLQLYMIPMFYFLFSYNHKFNKKYFILYMILFFLEHNQLLLKNYCFFMQANCYLCRYIV